MIDREHHQAFERDGYFVVDDAIEPELMEPMRAAAVRIKAKVRAGEVDVFTQWAEPGEPFNILGMLSPDFDEPVFSEYLLCRPLMDAVIAQIGSELRWEWLSLFTNPYHANFRLGWHRDLGGVPQDLPAAEELENLHQPREECRWELALVDDVALRLVPGSQYRHRTGRETEAIMNNLDVELPGQVVLELKAGQTFFWNGKIIHASQARKDRERLTLTGAYCQYSPEEKPQKVNGKIRWMLEDRVRDYLPEEMHLYYDRWRAVQLP